MFLKASLILLGAIQVPFLVHSTALPHTSSPEPELVVPRAPSRWVHPGLFLNKPQLELIKSNVNAGRQPWKGAYDSMLGSNLTSRTRKPSPVATVECGPTSTPDIGCHAEREDALAAYALSLAWYISGKMEYATKAISYLNAWSSTIKNHTYSNAPLQTGWAGASWVRAAEIIRYSNAGWSTADIVAFETMLRTVYVPVLSKGSDSNGNWELGTSLPLRSRKSPSLLTLLPLSSSLFSPK